MSTNPFIDDSIVKGRDYCSRGDIESKILTKLVNGHNLVLIGDRRVGKTSTAHHVIDKVKKAHKVDVDFYHVLDATDIAEAIIDACKKVLDEVWDSKKVLDFASRVTPTLDVTAEGVSFGVGIKNDEYKKTLNIAFEFLEEVIKRTKENIVILFDEFQTIKEVKNSESILKYMRGKIQKMPRIPFMYVGSIRHEMDHLFRDQSSPFYKQAEIIYFEHIEANIFYDFIYERFQNKKISLQRDAYDYLYQMCYGITGDIQAFCRVAFDTLHEGCFFDFEALFSTLEIIYKNEQKYFKGILDIKDLTKVQKNLLIQLAGTYEQDNVKLFSEDLQKAIEVKSPGAVTNAINALEKKGHIYKSDAKYHFTNPFFKEWILDYRYFIKATSGNLKTGIPLQGTRLDFGYRERIIHRKKSGSLI